VAVRRNSQNHGSGILNVLLHGAFTFVLEENADHILALIPELKDHAYRAGSWLAETELYGGRGATYGLTGVIPGGESHFDHEKNLLVKFRGKPPAKPPRHARRYATLIFPKPRMITSLRVAEIPTQDFFPKQSKNLVVPGPNQHMATLQVFTYDIDKENELALKAVKVSLPRATKLEDHYWEPAFTGNYVNLHIFSSEDYYHKASNAGYDLNQCIALLGVNLEVDVRYVPTRGIPATDESTLRDLGVTPIETEDLASRTRRLAELGRRVAQNGDADLAWYGTDVLDGGGELCGDAVGIS
jgi:hypothetical protein